MFRVDRIPLIEDVHTACRKDPALRGMHAVEVVLYPGLWAVWSHRLAHLLWRCYLPFVPRLLSQLTRLLTGVEIHPGARIGRRLFIDHGMGVVIGETARIGDDVTLYHGVTLGARGWWSNDPVEARHPRLGDRVTVGAGACLLGPLVVGADAHVGAHCVVTTDVPAGATVRPDPVRIVKPTNIAVEPTNSGDIHPRKVAL